MTQVEAPITGTVFRIETSVGAQVEAGEVVLVIESMKMEMPIETPAGGRVSEIRVEQGQSIAEGDTLLVLE